MNKGRIVQITIGSIVLIGLMIASLFVIEISKSNRKEFLKGMDTIPEPFRKLTSSANINFARQARSKNYITQGTMQLKLDGYHGQELEEKIEQETYITVTGRTNGLEKQSETEFIWKKDDREILKGKMLRDGMKIALKSDEIVNAYVAVENANLQDLLSNLERPASYPVKQIEENSLVDFFLLEEIEKEALKEYVTTLGENTKKDNYKKVKQVFSIEGKQKQITGYGLTLEKDEVRKLAISMCQALQEDSITLNLISKRMKTLGFPEEMSSINAIHEQLETTKRNLEKGSQTVERLTIVYYPWKKKCIQLEVYYGEQELVLQQDPKTSQVDFSWKTKSGSGQIRREEKKTSVQFTRQEETWSIVQEVEEKATGLNSNMVIIAKDATGTFQINYKEEKIFQEDVGRMERLTTGNSVTLNQYPKEELRVLLQAIQSQWDMVLQSKREQLM